MLLLRVNEELVAKLKQKIFKNTEGRKESLSNQKREKVVRGRGKIDINSVYLLSKELVYHILDSRV